MQNRYPVRKYPEIGVCGLDCGLCPRYHSDGKSRCPGCCGDGFWEIHPSCSFITCAVKQKGLETCAQCNETQDCLKYVQLMEAAELHDSFISYRSVLNNNSYIKTNGIAKFAAIAAEKQKILLYALENYDDGRSKLFLCTACQLIPLKKLHEAIELINSKIFEGADKKKRAKITRATLNKMADSLKIELKLRK
ncbi:MAG: DUF3795 domain-containing protein [Dehalococcoidales bacterium]|nr:DUF3795 domain-containing protein [Dehalococcoidales bacterium]